MQQKNHRSISLLLFILTVLLVNLLAALNFANVFFKKNVWKIKKNVKNVTEIKKSKKRFLHLWYRATSRRERS